MINLTSSFLEDEAVRYKEIVKKRQQRDYYLKRRVAEDEMNIEQEVPPIPQFKKVEQVGWRPASKLAFITQFLP